MVEAIRNCILPLVLNARAQLVAQAIELHGSSSNEAEAAGAVRATLSFDGEDAYLAAIIQEICVNPLPELENKHFELVKFAAAASKIQQPNDVSPSFMVLKKLVKRLYTEPATFPEVLGALGKQLEAVLEPIKGRSYDTFYSFLTQLPYFLSSSFSFGNVRQGWQKAGYVPFKVDTILGRCTAWADLAPKQSRAVREAIGPLTEYVREHGQIPDAIMQTQLGTMLDLDVLLEEESGEKKKKGKPLEKQSLNRRRALLLSHEEVMASYLSEEGKRKGMPPLSRHSRYFSPPAATLAAPAPAPAPAPPVQAPDSTAPIVTLSPISSSSLSSKTPLAFSHGAMSTTAFSSSSSQCKSTGTDSRKTPSLAATPSLAGPLPMDVEHTERSHVESTPAAQHRIPSKPQKRALPAIDIPEHAAKRAREEARRSALLSCMRQFWSLK